MGERKGTNKYYPPDFDPKKHFNLDKYHGTHALRERAKKISQGILVIRFEMPYNIWCGGCGIHIAMGVRYNAEKSRDGSYYTTPIWKFRMKCHLCDNYFEIKTDPANHDYVIVSGARRKEQRWDPKENEQIVPEDKNDIKKMATDAMFKLEHSVEDKAKVKAVLPGIAEITDIQQTKRDDYRLNSLARKKFREEKNVLKQAAFKDADLLKKSSLGIELVKEHEDDIKMAKLMKYKTIESFDEKQLQKRNEIHSRSLFDSSPSTSTTTSKNAKLYTSPNDTKKKLQLLATKAKTTVHDTFAKSLQCKVKTTPVLGIVTKKTKSVMNEKIKDLDTSTDNNKQKEAPQIGETDSNNTGTISANVFSLVKDYSSSSESD